MKIIITGGAGFIGSHLADHFLNKNYEVVVVDNFSHGYKKNLSRKVKIYTGDIRDQTLLNDIFTKEKPNVVSHHAALMTEKQVIDATNESVNVDGTKAVLHACKINTIDHVIFASSAAVYGNTTVFPTPEDVLCKPIQTYGNTKLAAEKLVLEWGKRHHISTTALRYSNVYGPRQRGGVIFNFFKQLTQHKPLIIDSDGTQTRDFIYIDDVVRANEAVVNERTHGIYNIATTTETSIIDLAKYIASNSHQKNITYRDTPQKQIQRSVLDTTKAHHNLNWQARITLKQGLVLVGAQK